MPLLFAALALDALFSTATLTGAHTGALVVDAQSGRVVYARNADDAFVPASVMKLLVGSVALERLGESFSYTTNLTTDGTSLSIEGGGDPLLSEKDANDAAATVAALNLTAFPGGLHANSTRYAMTSRYPDGWQIDDLAYDYAAPVSALSFNENAVDIMITGAKSPSADPTVAFSPDITPPCIQVRRDAGVSEPTLSVTADAPNDSGYGSRNCIFIRGAFAAEKPVTLSAAILEPETFALAAFQKAFAAHAITVAVPPYPQYLTSTPGRVLWTHQSIALPALLGAMWQPSDNLLAESLLNEIGLRASPDRRATREQGIATEKQWLTGIGVDSETLTIADGSGMSAYDRVTPRALVAMLLHDWNGTHRGTVLAALPVAGKSGTLEHVFENTPLSGNLIAKTGTSNHTRTLAGYLSAGRRTYVFALLVNDWMDSGPGAAARLRRFQQNVLTRIRDDSAGV